MSNRMRSRSTFLASVVVCLVLLAGCARSSDEGADIAAPLQVTPSVSLLPADGTGQTEQVTPAPTAPPTPAPPAVEVSTTPTPIPTPDSLSCLSVRQRVAQLLLPLLTQPEIPGAQAFAADGELGGIGLLGEPDERIAANITALQQSSFVPLLIASDEEGGSVQRLAALLGPVRSAAETARLKTPEETQREWVEYGVRVRDLGIDVVFGPVLDVGSGPGIASRSFGDDPQVVASYGRAVASGLLEAGITPVFKHFPGHGRATADSHFELPTTPSLSELRSADLIPYVDILSDPVFNSQSGVMIGHLSVPGLSEELPTSMSPATISGLLREELGFAGLVFTDAMNMGAIVNTYGLLDAIEQSIVAGADILILGSLADVTPALDYLVSRAEQDAVFAATLDNRAARVLAAKGQTDLCAGAQ